MGIFKRSTMKRSKFKREDDKTSEVSNEMRESNNKEFEKLEKAVNKKDKVVHGRGMIVIICISITIIVLVNTICIIGVCCPELVSKIFGIDIESILPDEKKVESAIISTGLSIIGMAIAVWTGLNIANTIDKKRLDDVDKEIKDLEKSTKDLEKTTKEALMKQIDSIKIEFLEEIKEQQNQIEKEKLIYEMRLIPKDIATQILANKLDKIGKKSDVSFFKLLEIEQKFRSVYERHKSEFNQDKDLIQTAEDGISQAEELLKNVKEDTIKLYLDFRIAEFYFYCGYCYYGKKRYDCFLKAIKKFENYKKEFDADIPEYVSYEDYSEIAYLTCEGELDSSSYFCNSVGEAYSKIIQIKNDLIAEEIVTEDVSKEYGLKAVFYCSYANHWKKKSVYKRNLGCAIERLYDKNYLSQHYEYLKKLYEEALKGEPENKNNFKNLVSLYDKKVNSILKIGSVTLPARREIPLCGEKFADMWENFNEGLRKAVFDLLRDIHTLSKQVKALHPSESVGYQYDCIYYRDMCAIRIADMKKEVEISDREKAVEIYDKAEENWKVLSVIAPYNKNRPKVNPMTEILRKDLDDLERWLKG